MIKSSVAKMIPFASTKHTTAAKTRATSDWANSLPTCHPSQSDSIYLIKAIALPKVCARKLSDWNVGLPGQFPAHTVSLHLQS